MKFYSFFYWQNECKKLLIRDKVRINKNVKMSVIKLKSLIMMRDRESSKW